MGSRTLTVDDFWDRVQREPSGCWTWTGPRGPRHPYGLAQLDGERMTARQAAWLLEHGELPGARLLPACGYTPCMNPAHQRPTITEDDVLEIVAAVERGERHREIAERYGCSRPHLCKIIGRHRAGKERAHAAS
jgi:hypothetical protein